MSDHGADKGGEGGLGGAGAADQARHGAEQIRDAFNEHVVDPARRAGEAMRASGERIAQNGSALGSTIIDQAEANAREAFAALRSAAGARDLTEVMRIQGEYLREQGQRSMEQAREIGQLIMQFGREAIQPTGRGEEPKQEE
ncbi:phasin family protein [Sphingomonas yunnanensis]|uniref:phasin family protein n=1 Tax=Sphingomonas yunnanensis TaxID=310400 RepID=UPI001CA6F0FF|nr:phasin family protein [Sphingomonas yunnanensis]MBY9062234.1 phasin family protein [Sphingomonas yunnanensis]